MNSDWFVFTSLCVLEFMSTTHGRRFQRSTSGVPLNVDRGRARSTRECGALCARSSSCKAFCYSPSTALCRLSQPSHGSAPVMSGIYGSDLKCFDLAGCPSASGYAMYATRCIKGYAERKNYHQARAICTQDGGHLYHYKTLDWDRQPIEDLKAARVELQVFLWVGADDLASEGVHVWSDSTPLDPALWGDNQPDNSYDEDCVNLRNAPELNDLDCDTSDISFVCQIDI